MSLQALNHKIVGCDHCQLSTIRKYAVIGQGSSSSEMMLIGQSPGKKEDESNMLFVGPSGKIFDNQPFTGFCHGKRQMRDTIFQAVRADTVNFHSMLKHVESV